MADPEFDRVRDIEQLGEGEEVAERLNVPSMPITRSSCVNAT